VPQAGAYDTDSEWWRGLSSTAATANPADWSAYNGVFVFSQFVFAISAGANPNPGNPPFYLDLAYELVDGAPQLVPERWEKQLSQDCVNGLLDAYLNQPVALAGIKVVHGTSDAVIPVSQARTVHEIFGNRGIEHVYVEHAGGHEFVPEESLQFLGDNLSWQQTPSAIAIETWGDVKAAHRE